MLKIIYHTILFIAIITMIYTCIAPIFKQYVFQAICAITTIILEITGTIMIICDPSISTTPITLTIIINIIGIITFIRIAKNAIYNHKEKKKTE